MGKHLIKIIFKIKMQFCPITGRENTPLLQ